MNSYFTSTLFRKIIAALSGLFLVAFLIGHLVGNLQLFIPGLKGQTQFNQYAFFRIAQRFLVDQTINVNSPIEIRFRYRMTFELPLNGRSIDSKEWYLKLNNEFLNFYENKKYNLEFRSSPLVGFKFSDQNKLEFGLDYRDESVLYKMSKHQFWLSLNWFIIL